MFERVSPGEAEALARWLASDDWPYHVGPSPDREATRARLENAGEEQNFWTMLGVERVGLVRLQYLGEPSPTTDFRLLTPYRGRGLGGQMVRWAARHIFETMPGKPRLEGETLAENVAMRRVFRRCGWVQEAYYRSAWPAGDETYRDSVGYAILREDWLMGGTTPAGGDEPPG